MYITESYYRDNNVLLKRNFDRITIYKTVV